MQKYQKALSVVLFILSAGILSATAQSPVFKQPADYNDYIVVEQTVIGKKIEAFTQSMAAEDFKTAKKQHAELVTQIEQSVKKIDAMPPYKGNTEFKKAAFELFVFYKMIIETDYLKIMQIAEKEGVNDKTFARINQIFVSVQRNEAVMYGAFNKAQTDFAKQFDMKISENELEKERRRQAADTLPAPK